MYVPKFPTPDNQSYFSWKEIIGVHKEFIWEDSILIGHSLGSAFILNLIDEFDLKPKSCFLVAPFYELFDNPEFDEVNKSFFMADLDWEKIKESCKKFKIYASTNDPYVPMRASMLIAEKLDIKIEPIEDAGHFNDAAGYTEFPQLLEHIKKVLKN